MGVSKPRYSVHHAYGVVQVQVQVDLQVGQRPAETFFQIRGEERMEKVPWRTRRKKDEAHSGERWGAGRVRLVERGGRGGGGNRELTLLIHLLVAFPVYILLPARYDGL